MVRSVSRIREVTAIIETPTGLRIVVDTSDTSVHTRVVNAVPRTWRGNVSVGRRERPGVVLWRRA